MGIFRTIRNYICYCGIEKEDYNALKKDAYVSNFRVWRVLHILMAVLFGTLFIKWLPNLLITVGGFTFCNIQALMWIESAGRVLVGLIVLKLRRRVEPDAA